MTIFDKRFVIGFTVFCLTFGVAALGASFYCERDLEKNGINIEALIAGGKK